MIADQRIQFATVRVGPTRVGEVVRAPSLETLHGIGTHAVSAPVDAVLTGSVRAFARECTASPPTSYTGAAAASSTAAGDPACARSEQRRACRATAGDQPERRGGCSACSAR